ncbi:MAG: protease modulator HflC [Treponema sp.]|nr:protease modulator HflC [Treponema sp.]MCL2236977.1 protease modulator HflC [Treponema sp.]
MKKIYTTLIVIAAIIIGLFLAGPFFVINEGEQAVIIQLGTLKRVITDAGLKLKIPFIDEVVRYPKKIMAWSGTPELIPTAEGQYIFVDVVARWRISDPSTFYKSLKTEATAIDRLGRIIESSVRTVVAENPLIESVRNSNIITERAGTQVLGGDDIDITVDINVEEIGSPAQNESNHRPITKGRRQLAQLILARSSQDLEKEFGIELIDIVTRQISYSAQLTQSVYARMIRERNQLAMAYRSDGEGRKAEWMGKMNREKETVLSGAYEQSQTIMGRADAEAARIYSLAYSGGDRANFYSFWRAIESYRQTMPKFDKTLTTDMEYFRYLYSPR